MRYKVVEQQSMCQEMILCISLQCCYKYGHMLNNEINVLTADHVHQSSSFRVFYYSCFCIMSVTADTPMDVALAASTAAPPTCCSNLLFTRGSQSEEKLA